MIKINLVPQALLDVEDKNQKIVQATTLAGFLLLIIASVSFNHWRTAHQLAAELAQNEASLEKVKLIVGQVNDLEGKIGAIQARLNIINNLLLSRLKYPRFLSEFSQMLTAGVWIESMTTSEQANSMSVQMRCAAISHESIADWLRELENSQKFATIDLGMIVTKGIEGLRLYEFPLTAVYQESKQ
ncbi:MAG: PilN domain-containing protein [Elusimicrobia bacterium]|nr:PilN domain-containing protein [Elusimicrobiota bacterium]